MEHPFSPPPTPTPARIRVSWGPTSTALGVLALLGVVAVANVALLVILRLIRAGPGEVPLWAVLFSTFLLQMGMLLVAGAFGPWRRGPWDQLLGWRRLGTLASFGWGALALVTSMIVSAVYVTVAQQVSERLIPDALPGGIDFTQLRWVSFISIVLIAPFAEEVFFRGFVFAGFAKRYGFWVGALVSAIAFAIVHLELARTVPAMLSGIIFAWVYWRSGSVWPAVLAHTAQNALAFGLA